MYTCVNHPLVQHKLSILRDSATGGKLFRELASEITMFLAYEAFKDAETVECKVETPMETATCRRLKHDIVAIPILRAGIGMLDGFCAMIPSIRIGFIGLYRDHSTAIPISYYAKLPEPSESTTAVVVDPMLATGGSAADAIDTVKKRGYKHVIFLCIVSCPTGIETLQGRHPDVPIFTAAVDRELNENKYILPGLGDAGDRLFGTR